jgi:predicted nucleic acid-binding protein
MSAFLDTNILLYFISLKPIERSKRLTAEEILKRTDLALSVQVLQEFYVQATRTGRIDAVTHRDAVDLMMSWLRFRVVDLDQTIVFRALEIKAAHKLSYWDGAIIAAAENAGCKTLLTEDLNHGQTIADVKIVNPFL